MSNVEIDGSKEYEYQGSNEVFAPTGLESGKIEVDYYSFYKIADDEVEGINIFDKQFAEDNSTAVSTSGWYVVIVTFNETTNYNKPSSIRKLIKINV